jgi:uncharacterized protein (TIGR02266 family)
MSSADKRKQERVPVELWIEAERDGELYFQRAINISVGGAFFAQTIPLPLGTRVDLKFEIPGDPVEVRCKGEIVTAKDLGMGVSFIDLKSGDRARIEMLIMKAQAAASRPKPKTGEAKSVKPKKQ